MKIPDNFSRENRIPVTFIWDFAVISVILRSKSLDFIIGISKKRCITLDMFLWFVLLSAR